MFSDSTSFIFLFCLEAEHQSRCPAAPPGGQGVGAHGGLSAQPGFLRNAQHRQPRLPDDQLPGEHILELLLC